MQYPVISLSDVVLHELKPCKVTLAHRGSQDHCRWVLQGPMPDQPGIFYYKIWNPTYIRRDNVPAAVEAGFYDDRLVPALHALIVQDGLCRGYVMREGRTRHRESVDAFREVLCARTRETGWFCIQFSAWHTLQYQGRWSLYDLEAVYPLRELPRLLELDGTFEDFEYLRFVFALYRSGLRDETLTGSAPAGTSADLPPEDRHFSVRRHHPLVRRLWLRPSRIVARRFRNLLPRTDLIQGVQVDPGRP